ncbi:MAG: O-acetyl-ADP-ribose deacetylase [Tissierellaceae bacterium]
MYYFENTIIEVQQGDITEVKVEAIVNAANNTLLGGGGVDGAIHRAGGKIILEQCKKIGGCPTGEARITVGGNLPCNYVIHTVGPIYSGGESGEEQLLYNAYYNSLKLAKEYNIKSVAFPSISTGAYGYPIVQASKVALDAVLDFIKSKKFPEKVVFVLFNAKDFQIYENLISEALKD